MTLNIILLLIVAIFLFIRLRNKFGTFDETDEERKEIIKSFKKDETRYEKNFKTKIKDVTGFKRKKVKKENLEAKEEVEEEPKEKEEQQKKSPLDKKLDVIFAKIGEMNKEVFIEGAEIAFEMIVKALSEKDEKTLKPLLSKSMFNEFKKEIDKMEKKGQKMSATIVSIPKKEVQSAKVIGKYGYIDILFVSEQIIFVEDEENRIKSGSKEEIKTISEIWTFRNDLEDENPNWVVIGTKAI